MKLIFMGTPAFAVPALTSLQEAGHEIVAVYTQPPRPAGRGQKDKLSPIHAYAIEKQLPVYTPTSLREAATQAEFAALGADAAIVAAYGLLLPPAILAACPYGCINIHPSLLPRWRGAAPIHRPLLAGDKETGVTIMQMDKGLDTGDMLLIEREVIKQDDTSETLHDRLALIGAELVVKTLARIAEGTIKAIKQPEEGVTYAAKLTKEEGRIDWQLPAENIERMIRAFTPWPGAYTTYQGETIKILQAHYSTAAIHAAPGTLVGSQFTVACGQGSLQPLIVQRAGKSATACDAFLRGFPLQAGEVLS